MPWTSRRHGHHCHPPSTKPLFRRVETGDTWRCWRCGQDWVLTYLTFPNYRYSMSWRKIEP